MQLSLRLCFLRSFLHSYKQTTNTTELKFLEFDLQHLDATPRTWIIPTPKDTTYGNVHISPSGDRLLWRIESREYRFFDRCIHFIIPIFKMKEIFTVSWRVSKLDGSGVREISCHVVPSAGYEKDAIPEWTPDGKHVSFIYNDVLYRITAE